MQFRPLHDPQRTFAGQVGLPAEIYAHHGTVLPILISGGHTHCNEQSGAACIKNNVIDVFEIS
jgi:hypothetical protein